MLDGDGGEGGRVTMWSERVRSSWRRSDGQAQESMRPLQMMTVEVKMMQARRRP
jgi:hypothetical protein